MSANDILDVLNVQRDETKQPPKKKRKAVSEQPVPRQTGMTRELYNLLGPNTPPVTLSTPPYGTGVKDKFNAKPSPWTKIGFSPFGEISNRPKLELNHWVKGSKELLEQELSGKPYPFEKFNIKLDIPELVDEGIYNKFMDEIKESEKKLLDEQKEREQYEKEIKQKESKEAVSSGEKEVSKEQNGQSNNEETAREVKKETPRENTLETEGTEQEEIEEWTYSETKHLFELCNVFELKWNVIYDRFNFPTNRSLEDLKNHFYRICAKILQSQPNANPNLIESLQAFSKPKEVERKHYLESLLKRTPAEIAEEESLVIEARRFELAAKKMLIERSHLLTLLDSPQTSQSVQQYQSSQGLANLYNNLMIMDKHQKKRQLQQQKTSASSQEPVPPPIPIAASSSFKKERSFQTPLQQHLSGVLKQNQMASIKQETNAIQQLLMKRLTVKEEEAYGLHYHANEKLTPGVILRSSQKLPGLQQRQSVLKSVNNLLQELDIPTAGGTSWKPVMPTRKTMSKYDELLRSVVTLLDIKKGKDRLESEIRLIKSQRGLQ